MTSSVGPMLIPRWLFVTQAALWVLLCGSAVAAEPSTIPATQPADVQSLNGRWKLNWELSESADPMMEALEISWFLRKLAGVVSVQVIYAVEPPECEGCKSRLRITLENPIKKTDRVVLLDGVARPAIDPLGNESLDQFSWDPEHGMQMVRDRSVKSGKSARIVDFRRVGDDLQTLVSNLKVWIDGEERVSVRRVFDRVDE